MRTISVLLSAISLFFSSLALAEPLDLNSATAEQLAATLNGIGDAKAQAIVAYRNAHGPFQRVEDITLVKGIGESTLNDNRDRIAVSIAAE